MLCTSKNGEPAPFHVVDVNTLPALLVGRVMLSFNGI